jgi:hypothetical protein
MEDTPVQAADLQLTRFDQSFQNFGLGVVCCIIGVAFIGFSLMFLQTAVFPEIDDREREYCENQIDNEKIDFYDRRSAKTNCKRICKSMNPMVWLVPI